MKKLIFLIIVLVIVVAAGYWQYQEYLEDPDNKINRIVNNVSSGVTEALLYEIEDSIGNSKITYRDLFKKLEIHHAQVDSNISELKKIIPTKNINGEKVNLVMKYLESCQQLLIAEHVKYIRNMEYTGALKTIRVEGTELGILVDTDIQKGEYEKAEEELAKALIKFFEAYSRAAGVISKDNLVEKQIIDKAISKYSKR